MGKSSANGEVRTAILSSGVRSSHVRAPLRERRALTIQSLNAALIGHFFIGVLVIYHLGVRSCTEIVGGRRDVVRIRHDGGKFPRGMVTLGLYWLHGFSHCRCHKL